ncbi:hypothetical protein MMC17_007431 [Xylographa soralifera]|nr:hypothetical protein [Xylographa soralifera]
MDTKAPLLPVARARPTPRLTLLQHFLRAVFHLSIAVILLLALLGIFSLGVYCAVSSRPTAPLLPRSLSHTLTARFLPPNATLPPTHGRCNIHVYQSPYYMIPDIPGGSIWVRVTDNADREIGHLDWTDWNTANGPTEFNVSTRVGVVAVDVQGFDVDFRIAEDGWAVGDRRCHLGDWDRVVLLKWDLRRPNRQMDCGFAC